MKYLVNSFILFCGITWSEQILVKLLQLLNKEQGPNLNLSGFGQGLELILGMPGFEPMPVSARW